MPSSLRHGGASKSLVILGIAFAALAAGGCNRKPAQQQPPPAMEVSVVKVAQQPVAVSEEFVAQTQAPKTIEIRSQVTGLLERQAFSDGARVRQGELLYVIDARPFKTALTQAQANLAQAEANLQNARQTLRRYKDLVGQGFVSKQAYENAVAQERAGAAQVAAQRAQVNDARINLGYTEIHAPNDGYMSESRINPGALVTAQQTLLNTLYSSDPMFVYFTVSEQRMLELQRELQDGAPPKARIVLSDGSQYPQPGSLDFVDAAVDQKTGTLQLRVAIPNPDRALRPNMFVRVVLPALTEASGIRIPQQAVTELQGTKTVYVVGPDGKAQSRQITADLRSGNDWVVQKGLAAGELVIVEGVQKVQMQPNAPVKPVIVAQNAPADDPSSEPAGAAQDERSGAQRLPEPSGSKGAPGATPSAARTPAKRGEAAPASAQQPVDINSQGRGG